MLALSPMEIYISVPKVVDDLDVLVWRMEKFHGVTAHLIGDRVKLIGSADKLLAAQNYALRFIGPESISLIHVSPECLSLFHVTGVIRHFETAFKVIICVMGFETVLLKGRKSDIERCHKTITELEVQCSRTSATLTSFKLSNLRMLCQKFSVVFNEIPCSAPVQIALLTHFSSLLDPSSKVDNLLNQSPAYVEVYRKQCAGSLIPQTAEFGGQNGPAHKRTDAMCVSTVPVVKEKRAESVSRENAPVPKGLNPTMVATRLRSVVIDGSNVAFAHGLQQKFSPKGIWLALEFFLKRGHTNVVAVVPRFRRGLGGELFDRLERKGYLTYSSSRVVNDEQQVADDDRIILQLAVECNGVVVSNDQFRNYREENEQFRDLIDHRLLQYTLALNTFLIAEDPHGPKGPSLSECLCIPSEPKNI
ncbi:hypothetical protein EG68_04654 [Paragonimus skrjabini miyazakii]|uniref:RNase NYN domain-containing protein n=1 Tax=Paragonimus skrjabini miyazakii TaxID=59628 RepID=A0A8S9YSY8_9TREM|nr:hypothetical protein EG68_04654 [Paragonimus skrjabini miyazakii]